MIVSVAAAITLALTAGGAWASPDEGGSSWGGIFVTPDPSVTPGSTGGVIAPPDPIGGGVYGWGWNVAGSVGDGTTIDRSAPVAIPALPNSVRQVDVDNNSLSLAVLTDGTVYTWGKSPNGEGAMGDGTAMRAVPGRVPGLTGITQASTEAGHVLALATDWTVWAWGTNAHGEQGDATTNQSLVPKRVPGLTGITRVAAGTWFSLALRYDGTVWAWGDNSAGELGDGGHAMSTTPKQVPGQTGVIQIAVAGRHAFALHSDGSLWAWGDNEYGELGMGSSQLVWATPAKVALTGVTRIAAGVFHTLAVAGAGYDVWAWGSNRNGQLGNGTSGGQSSAPQRIGLAGVAQISAGINESAAILPNGTLWTWGLNRWGQVGIGSFGGIQTSPAQVVGVTGVTQVAVGNQSLAIGAPTGPVPDVRHTDMTAAKLKLQNAGFAVGTVTNVVDRLCESIGLVMSQSPSPGVYRRLGTPVELAFGIRGGSCL